MLIQGDCLEKLKTLPDNSVDSLVTDPPAGISFMNKEWDGDKGGRDQWIAWFAEILIEAKRVMKPGAHGLVWALPRTSHWTATALENAGFEVRDVVTHLFGTGFPKSMDISKAIDKAAGAVREVGPVDPARAGRLINQSGNYETEAGWSAGGRKVTTDPPATDAAKEWVGWGTALKPASEHWILIRKPLSEKTVAANVLKWGTGGINIDGCRIGTQDFIGRQSTEYDKQADGWGLASTNKPGNPQGRFPANLVLDEEAAAVLDAQSGTLGKSSGGGMNRGGKSGVTLNRPERLDAVKNVGFGDSGGASRFFYVAKASASEKNAGLEEVVATTVNDGRETPIDNPFQRGETARKNTHPTVKSLKLMEYLIKLVTPQNGTILDPFMGSGSTGVAAKNLGMNFIGIEVSDEYFQIAEKRIAA